MRRFRAAIVAASHILANSPFFLCRLARGSFRVRRYNREACQQVRHLFFHQGFFVIGQAARVETVTIVQLQDAQQRAPLIRQGSLSESFFQPEG